MMVSIISAWWEHLSASAQDVAVATSSETAHHIPESESARVAAARPAEADSQAPVSLLLLQALLLDMQEYSRRLLLLWAEESTRMLQGAHVGLFTSSVADLLFHRKNSLVVFKT